MRAKGSHVELDNTSSHTPRHGVEDIVLYLVLSLLLITLWLIFWSCVIIYHYAIGSWFLHGVKSLNFFQDLLY